MQICKVGSGKEMSQNISKVSTESGEAIFVMDDMSDIWNTLTDVQKAEWRKLFADIRVKNGIKPIIFSIVHKDVQRLRSQ